MEAKTYLANLFVIFFLLSQTPTLATQLDPVKVAAEQGDKEAQFQLGLKYLKGQDGLDLDSAKACQWFLKAAEQNQVLAQYNVGICYREGSGFSKDLKRAFEWFFKSANQGDLESSYNVALAYHFGEGTQVDLTQAVTWYQKAIEKHHIPALYGLGLIYTNGNTDLPVDHPKALALYQQAAQAAYAPAQYMIGLYYEKALGGLEMNQKLAFDWYTKAADQKFKRAYLALANLYKSQKNWEKYFFWIQTTASEGIAEGQLALGIAFRDGMGTPINLKEAIKWFLEASKQDSAQASAEAEYELGKIYLKNTELGAPNYTQAYKWIEESAKKGYGPAMAALGQLYWNGQGVQKSNSEGKSWMEKALKNQAPEAFLAVAKAYQLGQGGYQQSEQKAFEHYTKAAQLNNPEGQFQLASYYSDGQLVGGPDEKEAFKWLEFAANQHHKDALYEVARRYEEGLGVALDKAKAMQNYYLASNLGEPKSKVRLGKLFIAGKIPEKDAKMGFNLIKSAVESGYTPAEYDLALLYFKGVGTDKNLSEAIRLFELAGYKGISEAQYQLGLAYASGLGIKEDKITAYAWLTLAAKSGNQLMIKARDAQLKKLNKDELDLAKKLSDSMNAKMLNIK